MKKKGRKEKRNKGVEHAGSTIFFFFFVLSLSHSLILSFSHSRARFSLGGRKQLTIT